MNDSKIYGSHMKKVTKELDSELKFNLESNLSEALEILDPLLAIGSTESLTKKKLRTVRKLIWLVEAMLVDEGLIHTPTPKIEYEVETAHWFNGEHQPILYSFVDRDEALDCWLKDLVEQIESDHPDYATIRVNTVIEDEDEYGCIVESMTMPIEYIDPFSELGISEEMVYAEAELKSLEHFRGLLFMADDPDHEDEIGEIYERIETLQKKGAEILFGSTWGKGEEA